MKLASVAMLLSIFAYASAMDADQATAPKFFKNARKEQQFPFGQYNIVWFSSIRGTGTENIAYVYPGWKVAIECNNAKNWVPEDFKKLVCEGKGSSCTSKKTLQALFPGVPDSHQWWTGGDGIKEPAVLNVPENVPVSKTFSFRCEAIEDSKAKDQSYIITLVTEEAPENANFRA
ncbi:SAG-related sequence SRS42 [Toxoplasma gondii TgCatPRC2]|uniref:SRS42 n=11 Tax=Toxoplasma gondii TaxID=5811 RepID=B9PWF2_TOXGV|nr:SAG-related sequence SRS42 [Toxoplasma gondii ME49]EPR61869.1 SAG-related sequence SRS42 [Toxoplasma gondii GT1]ESS30881.1 SAG-related sequence SRS42 [Toxoplasma gondii VEG]KAF4640332.1 SAG-related sequence SRS42 [Toxoplasma gondii]KFG45952.1 SAG-related sequence SRS42 [Toxoplasma gondii GAB2-2007-GAL-DOM2]KFG58076.1 SAG-related sequence SRS42 [Toxoplasma gondii RUB]KFG99694.1 SAG-related sequence SRS42 [Toxoplasma gondii VAND]KFH07924.1 SAG-related sequence SRS42 [Toxoplasma gondii MAS]|eukprot:XP_002368877.1 SAG-related sequence SRS42 [Toxoplasma gondii ME49]